MKYLKTYESYENELFNKASFNDKEIADFDYKTLIKFIKIMLEKEGYMVEHSEDSLDDIVISNGSDTKPAILHVGVFMKKPQNIYLSLFNGEKYLINKRFSNFTNIIQFLDVLKHTLELYFKVF